jgi:alkylhydroperoxidase family enzyme
MALSTEGPVPLLSAEEARLTAERAGVPDALATLNVFRLLLRRAALAKGVSDTLLSLLAGEALDHRLRELVIMRIAWTTGSTYEWSQHWEIAQRFGVPAEDLQAVRQGSTASRLSEVERAALDAVDRAVAGRTIAPHTMAVLRAALADDALIELVACIGCWSMVSTVLRTFEVPLDEGLTSWPPDGTGPAAGDGVRDEAGREQRPRQ